MDNSTLFFWETVAGLCFFAVLVLAIGYGFKWIRDYLKQAAIEQRRSRSVAATISNITHENSKLRGELLNRFVEASNTSEYNLRTSYAKVTVDYVLERLKRSFTVETLSTACSINANYCNSVMKLTDTRGNTFFLALAWNEDFIVDYKGRRTVVGREGLDIGAFAFQNEDGLDKVVFSNTLEFCFPITVNEADESVVEVLNTIFDGTVEIVYHEEEKKPHSVKVHKLTYHPRMGYSVEESLMEIKILPNKVLDLSYTDVSYEFNGAEHKMTASKAFPVLAECLKLGENAVLFGLPGVGKSTLLEQYQAKLAQDPTIRVIVMTPAQIQELQKTEAQTAFEIALKVDGRKNIIFIDEGEALLKKTESGIHSMDNTLVLQMMSGALQKSLNCQLVIAFNARPEDLDKALFRKGRTAMFIDLKPLSKFKCGQLIDEIRRLYPERTFDRKQYEFLMNASNKAIDGVEYAKVGELTLADLYSCFIHKPKYAAIVRALGQATGKQESDIVAENKPGPTSPRVVTLPKKVVAVQAGPSAVKASSRIVIVPAAPIPAKGANYTHKHNHHGKKKR